MDAPLINLQLPKAGLEGSFAEFETVLRDKNLDADELPLDVQGFLTAVFALSPYLASLANRFPRTVLACRKVGFRKALDSALLHMDLSGDEQLDEVVVTALGFTQKKDETGFSSSTINTSDISRSGENVYT